MPRNGVSRRKVLKLTGASVGAVGTAGLGAGAEADRVEVNVGFANARGKEAALDAAAGVKREFDSIDAVTLDVSAEAVEGLANNPNVRYVEENGEMEALDTVAASDVEPEDHYGDFVPWGIERIDADVTHHCNETGVGANVAVIDTGIEAGHSDLDANLGNGACFTDCWTWPDWDDQNGHGTHVAGTVGAAMNDSGVIGVGPDITLHAVKVLGSGGGGSFSDIAAGIEWSADQGHDVANLSLGGGYSSVVHDACRYAENQGTLLVAAAGNDGCWDCVSYPAALDECIAVSATTEWDSLASFSSYGPEVELAAPGENVLSTYLNDGYDELSGTSMASPHVAGVGGLLMANGYSASQARSRMCETAEDIGLPSDEQGCGLVDAASALGC